MIKNSNHDTAVLDAEPSEKWVKTSVALKHLSISEPTLRRWVKAKRITPRRTPTGEFRFRLTELNALLA